MTSRSDPAISTLLRGKRTSGPGKAALEPHEIAYWVREDVPGTPEKRAERRARTRLRSGRILDARNRLLAEVALHDRSSTGWRLQLLDDVPLPSRFRFYDDELRRAFEAELVWRRGREVGVGIKA